MADRLLCHIYHETDGTCCGDGDCVCLRPVPEAKEIDLRPTVAIFKDITSMGFAIWFAAAIAVMGLAVMTGLPRAEAAHQIAARIG